MKLGCIMRDDGACSYYRIFLPLQEVSRKTGWPLETFYPREPDSKLERIVEEADILVIPRVGESGIIDIVDDRRARGLKTIIDWDDNIFEVSPLSHHYKDFGTRNIQVNGEWVWVDGLQFDRKANLERMETIEYVMSHVDLVTCTTEKLADVFRHYNKNVVALPNCLDMNIWTPSDRIKRNDNVRLMWTGGISHYEDWLAAGEAIVEVLNRNPSVTLVLMGAMFKGTLKGVNEAQIEYHDGVHFQAYPYKLMLLNADIGIIPLADTIFNEGKSALKWIEMAALGIPCVTSNIGPYHDIATECAPGLWIPDNNKQEWVFKIQTLIDDPILRADFSRAAREYVKANYDIKANVHKWIQTYEELMGG